MGYVHLDNSDIFVSYAHVDDDPVDSFANRLGWVTTLVYDLERELGKLLGRRDSYDLWSDAQLRGQVQLTPEILDSSRMRPSSSWCCRPPTWRRSGVVASRLHSTTNFANESLSGVGTLSLNSTRSKSPPNWPTSRDIPTLLADPDRFST